MVDLLLETARRAVRVAYARAGVRAVEDELRARASADLQGHGAYDRVEAVRLALRADGFQGKLHVAIAEAEALGPVRDENDIRAIVVGVLAGVGCDIGDVVLKINWNPGTRALGVSAWPGVDAAIGAVDRAKRQVAPRLAAAARALNEARSS